MSVTPGQHFRSAQEAVEVAISAVKNLEDQTRDESLRLDVLRQLRWTAVDLADLQPIDGRADG